MLAVSRMVIADCLGTETDVESNRSINCTALLWLQRLSGFKRVRSIRSPRKDKTSVPLAQLA